MNLNEEGIIFEEELQDDVLVVKVEAKLKRNPRDEKKNFFARDLLPILEKRYKIKSIISCCRVCNFQTESLTNSGVWKYEVEKNNSKPTKTRKTSTRASTNNSIRDRMSKIAKKE